MLEQAIILIAGIAVGGCAAWFLAKARAASDTGRAEARAAAIEEQLASAKAELHREQADAHLFRMKATKAETENAGLLEKLATQKAEMEQLQKRLTTEFENIANRILDEKAQKFTEQNKTNLGVLLGPLQDKLKDFQKRVEETYDKESKERVSLEREVKRLAELNLQISKDATDLTRALKGESKTQGNWGEMILETVLERSGLRKDVEFKVQESKAVEDGGRLRPDVVVYLPEGKNVVVDSKVSLTAYERFSSAETPEDRARHLAEHVASVRSHIKGLKLKSYDKLYGINTPDFVLMFMPLEPAFSAALTADDRLFADAFEQGIVIVSPTTLLTSLRTIANLWRQERQNRNVMEIARQAGDLYDKFVAFVDDMRKIDGQLTTVRKTYGDAMNKLAEGKGNLVGRAEKIRLLGAKTSKALPADLVGKGDGESGETADAGASLAPQES